MRFRLGLAPSDDSVTCKCDHVVTDRSFDHFRVCRTVRREAVTLRHDRVLSMLRRVARMAGVPNVIEYRPPVRPGVERLRPDILFQAGAASVLSDVAVTTPTVASKVERAARVPLFAAAAATKYAAVAERLGCRFVPFVLESFGAIGAGANQLIRFLALQARRNGLDQVRLGFRTRQFTHFVRDLIAVELQRGNAMLVGHAERMGNSGLLASFREI